MTAWSVSNFGSGLMSFWNLLFLLVEFVFFHSFFSTNFSTWFAILSLVLSLYQIWHTFFIRFSMGVLKIIQISKFFILVFGFWNLPVLSTISRYEVHFGTRLHTFPIFWYSSNLVQSTFIGSIRVFFEKF